MKSIIKKLITTVKKDKIIKDDLFNKYLESFYNESSSNDLGSYNQSDLINLCLSSFRFINKKSKNEFKVRAYNPTKKRDGFESEFTILDIVNNNAPFLVDSVIMQCDKMGIEVKNIIHPIFFSKRTASGVLEDLVDDKSGGLDESVMQLHLAHISSEKELNEIESSLNIVLPTVHLVVDDWRKMRNVIQEAKNQLNNCKYNDFDLEEYKNFLDWILDNKFIILGTCEFALETKGSKNNLVEVKTSNLGIFKSPYPQIKPVLVDDISGDANDIVKNPYVVEILKSRYNSIVHRAVNAERIRVQKFDNKGNIIGEYRFIGLFTSSVYYQSVDLTPIIRKKIAQIIKESNFKKDGHSAKDLASILESYPRDELFQIELEDLSRISLGIVTLSGRSLVRFFAREDKFKRFVSCLIFIPREQFNTSVQERIHSLLEKSYEGEILGSYMQVTESNLTRLHIIVRTESIIPEVNSGEIEDQLVKICRSWNDDFTDLVKKSFDRDQAKEIIANYQDAFPASYAYMFKAKNAIYDIDLIKKTIGSKDGLIFDIYKSSGVADDVAEIKIYSVEKKMQLSDIMPVLDSFGFNIIHENTYFVSLKNEKKVWIHYFNINLSKFGDILTQAIIQNFKDTISSIYQGRTQIGYLNRMVVAANLNNRQISLLRAYSKYLYQTGFRYSQKYTSDVLVKYRDITNLIVRLFETKFSTDEIKNRDLIIAKILDDITKSLTNVSDSIEDMILRRFVNIIDATIRTNFFQKDESKNYKDYISFKFNSSKIQDLALPVPYAEIFVFSSAVEGVHLRGGKVARGGLRWSDRHEDFRTEVLGLMKAQMTKNAVIVPSGSKGGFVVKADTSKMNREEITQEAIKCYKTFLRGLLDLTDNVINGKIVHPKDVIRYDEPDPYLVVAADKGTATFSDIANGISAEYNFWLGDAFASGGSVGYDHKKMGITAKGAWISVKRHFSEIGIDIQNNDFTCAGIGDLSGDVFGNGMLLSKHTKLVAAFNHLHIFLDPNPDVEKSYKERVRMFNLPRSSWSDYNNDLISKGGGIFERSAKSIDISKEVQNLLGIESDKLTPIELIKFILKAKVDLLWNGGIGTYVKASDESHLDVGDRINDVLRVNGSELRCKVVGEGGNLGFTQKGRIEYALSGGKLNTDAIDNSAGVDCSDHEVNIKIALTQAMKAGKVSIEERNKILESMTQEVENLVLEDNRLQTQTITMSESRGYSSLENQARFLSRLEKIGLLNREVEFLPSQKVIEKRQSEKIGMTRPELCVMMSYSKMDLYNNIVNSSLVKDKFFEKTLLDYFPNILQQKFKEEILNHQLRSEIIATQITNMIVGRLGITFVSQVAKDNGFDITDIVRNIIIVCESFELDNIWQEIESLDNKKVPVQIQVGMFNESNKLLERSVLWLLRNAKSKKDIISTADYFHNLINTIYKNLDGLLATASRNAYKINFDSYVNGGVDVKLAKKVASMDSMASCYDIIEISSKTNFDVQTVGKLYFKVGNRLHLKWLRSKITNTNSDNYWQKVSCKTILEDLYNYQMRITSKIVSYGCKDKDSCEADLALEKWIEKESFLVYRYDRFIDDFKSQIKPDLSMFVVALNRIKALVA